MAKAAADGIPIGIYLKTHTELLMRAQLERGDLPYEWTDETGNRRASDDGGPLPPRGWWRTILTTIDRQTHDVWGVSFIGPTFPAMYFVSVFPSKSKASPRRVTKRELLMEILTDLKIEPGLPTAKLDRMIWPEFQKRWSMRNPGGAKPSVAKKTIKLAYDAFLSKK